MQKKWLIFTIIVVIVGTSCIPNISGDMKTFNIELNRKITKINSVIDTNPPIITINFAGNLLDSGGPYWQPPGEAKNLSNHIIAEWREGYYTNDSRQTEDWIYINCTVVDPNGIDEVWLHWLNETIWVNDSYQFTNTDGDYWEFNSSGVIPTVEGYNYSFDIWAYDNFNNVNVTAWEKTGINGDFTRRYVQLNCTPVNISYIPFYCYEASYDDGVNTMDRLHHDQGPDGTPEDTGFLLKDVPTDDVQERHCALFVGYWFDESVCTESFFLRNIYHHFWWKTQGIGDDEIDAGWAKTNAIIPACASNAYYTNEMQSHSNITQRYHLETELIILNTTINIIDNNIYELVPLHIRGHSPSCISNRSFVSFVLFNVPSNETLNVSYSDSDGDGLSDWNELYLTYTSPFLVDTDNDGVSDFDEKLSGSDPNNYADTLVPPPSIVYVDDDFDSSTPGWGIDHFDMIQDGIDAVLECGDVYVYNGTYYENIVVDKTINLIGEDRNNTIINGGGCGYVIYASADWINISGFMVCNSGDEYAGIYVASDYNTISGNNINNNYWGIYLWYSSENTIMDCDSYENKLAGIYLHLSSNNKILNCDFYENHWGGYIWGGISLGHSSTDNIITNCDSYDNYVGIYLWDSSNNNLISSNNITNNIFEGIRIEDHSSNSTISDNDIDNNGIGIKLVSSSKNIVLNNDLFLNGIIIEGDDISYWNTHNIENNYANGRPIYYYKNNNKDVIVSSDAIQVILANCSNVTLQTLAVNNVDCGIQIGYSSYNNINSNIIKTNKLNGIYLCHSLKNNITTNTITNNTENGIFLYHSSNNTFTENIIEKNGINGIYLTYSYGNNFSWNDITQNEYGIFLEHSSNHNTIFGNNIKDTIYWGIIISDSSSTIITKNTIENNIYGIQIGYSSNNKIFENIIKDNNFVGISLDGGIAGLSTDNIVHDNIITNNTNGIELHRASNNCITRNKIVENNIGVYLSIWPENNIIYNNNFINNTQNARDRTNNNLWNSTHLVGGNYWSDYTGTDNNGDGIGDTPYNISGPGENKDHYPLIHLYGSITNQNTGEVYLTIQYAIDDISTLEGHTIFVKDGIYYENLIVNKSINIIGKNKENTVIDGSGVNNVILIVADGVYISEFRIQNGDQGISLDYSSESTISGNIIINNDYGIYLYQSYENVISENTIANNYRGFQVYITDYPPGEPLNNFNNLIYHNNFINNSQHAHDPSINRWNDTYNSGIGGGNYWDDYNGNDYFSGPNQDEGGTYLNPDGIGDTSYNIPGGDSQDHYPFMKPNSWRLKESTLEPWHQHQPNHL